MKYSIKFLRDFNIRDCAQHGHDPRNHIGLKTGLNNPEMVRLWFNYWIRGKYDDRIA